MKKMVKI